MRDLLDRLYQTESRRILATLIRLLSDFDLAEDALHEAFRAALEQWPRDGVPANPRTWLISTGRFKAIDVLRRRGKFETPLAEWVDAPAAVDNDVAAHDLPDDQLRLIFTCCHPALAPEARVALTLREVCGLSTEAIASAYLTTPSTLAQRIVRAKTKIRTAAIAYEVPERHELPSRLDAVLQVIYLVFNEGYVASSGEHLTRPDLSSEAIRLGRLLVALLPEAEAIGLLALMVLLESRRAARSTPTGEPILLEEQDRSLWQTDLVREGLALAHQAWLINQPIGVYRLQAAIAALHSVAPTVAETDWTQIIHLYDLLLQVSPSPVVALSRAGAVAMRDGPAAGVALINAILTQGDLTQYHFAYAARGELHRRMGRSNEARADLQRAIDLTQSEAERRFLTRRLDNLT